MVAAVAICIRLVTAQAAPTRDDLRGVIKRVIEPAILEVNGLSEFAVKVDIERAYSRAPIAGVTIGWWRKTGEEYRETYRERQRSKLGRMARLKGNVESVMPAGGAAFL